MSQELQKLLIDAKNNYGNSMGIPYNDFVDIVKEAYTLGSKERQEEILDICEDYYDGMNTGSYYCITEDISNIPLQIKDKIKETPFNS